MRLPTLALVFVLGLTSSACSQEEPATPAGENTAAAAAPTASAAPPPAPVEAAEVAPAMPEESPFKNWKAEDIARTEVLAAKLRSAGVPCDDFEVVPGKQYLEQLNRRLKIPVTNLPLAEAYCTSEADEDLTFTIFADAAHALVFVEAKRALLCAGSRKMNLGDFPGFPYIVGDTWLVQPDERATSVRLADILGGTAAMATCDAAVAPNP